MLQIKNLTICVHNQPIITNLSLDIPVGSLTALVGPNGSGKSTLAYALAGHPLYQITQGTIIFNGHDITEAEPDLRARSGLFLIMQQPPELPGVNVLTFLQEPYRALKDRAHSEFIEESKRESFDDLKTLATQALQAVGLPESFLSRSLHEGFSGGEKKRFEAAQLLLFKPSFAILDELDAGLDAQAFEAVIQVIQKLQTDDPAFTCLLITHNPRLLKAICPDQIISIHEGILQPTLQNNDAIPVS